MDFSEPRRDGFDRKVEQPCQQCRHDQRNEWPRYFRRDPGPYQNDGERSDRDEERPGVYGIECPGVGIPLRQERRRHRLHLESQEVTDLAREDDEGDAARESDGHGIRDELDGAAEAQQAERDEHDARQQRRHGEAIDAMFLHDAGHDHDERTGRPADLHPRASQQRNEKPSDDRRVETALRAQTTGDGKGDGER